MKTGLGERVNVKVGRLLRLQIRRTVNDQDWGVDRPERVSIIVLQAHADIHGLDHPTTRLALLRQGGVNYGPTVLAKFLVHGHQVGFGSGENAA